jgi:CSLREA domain-containing protein
MKSATTTTLLLLLISGSAAASTFSVTRLDDPPPGLCDSDCSLREAVEAANAAAGPDLIQLPVGSLQLPVGFPLPLGQLDLDLRSCYLLTLGELVISDSTEIVGSASRSSCLTTATADRILTLLKEQSLTLRHLVLTGGNPRGDGGAIDAPGGDAHIVLDGVVFYANHASDNGGALHALDATVEMQLTSFEENAADGSGGAIFGSGQYTFDTGIVARNHATGAGGAVSLQGTTSTSTWASLFVVANTASGSGGAFQLNGGVHELASIVLAGNTSSTWGGALRVAAGQASVVDASFTGNLALKGGAISVGNSNSTTSLALSESVVYGNQAAQEGGGFDVQGILDTLNVTVSGNRAAEGGGISLRGGRIAAVHTTVADNETTSADVPSDALLQEPFTSSESSTWINSVVSGACWIVGGQVEHLSLGGNLESPGNTCWAAPHPSDLTSQSAQELGLEPLAYYGGVAFATKTHALGRGSRAVDHGLPEGCPSPSIDQRHYLRVDGECDSGAHEQGASR